MIAFYISGHGFGHAVRCAAVMNALRRLDPSVRLHVRTAAPEWLFARTVHTPVACSATATDTGMQQIGSLHLDIEGSLAGARAFMRTFADRVETEAAWIRSVDAALVVADIPALGIAAAAAAGVPSVAFGNFTWDWIYAAYAGTEDLTAPIGDAYERASLALRLPMHGGFDRMATVVDVPLVARVSSREPSDVRRRLGLAPERPVVLVSFGGLGLDGLDLEALHRLDGYQVLVGGARPADAPPMVHGGGAVVAFDEAAMYAAGLRYEDVVGAADVVVSKPGYGIIADCVAHDTALLYTPRGAFREYDVLVGALPGLLRAHAISHADLFAGRWAPALDALSTIPSPAVRPDVTGADVVARRLLGMIGR